MIEIKPPHSFSEYDGMKAIFLAGSIDMGVAIDWQAEVAKQLEGEDILILNPRREEWDSSWAQKLDNPDFRGQVEWELQAMERADKILMYFAPGTKAPVTMLEFGLHAGKNPEKLVACAPEGFWRKGNIDITSIMYNVHQVDTLEDLIECAKF